MLHNLTKGRGGEEGLEGEYAWAGRYNRKKAELIFTTALLPRRMGWGHGKKITLSFFVTLSYQVSPACL